MDYEANVQPINPSQRYCANLGHVEDEESDLIYMRARYYEPWSGRFVSEDPARDRSNWYLYSNNKPSLLVDFTGHSPTKQDIWLAIEYSAFISELLFTIALWAQDKAAKIIVSTFYVFMTAWFNAGTWKEGSVYDDSYGGGSSGWGARLITGALLGLYITCTTHLGLLSNIASPASKAVSVAQTYVTCIAMFLTLSAIAEGIGP